MNTTETNIQIDGGASTADSVRKALFEGDNIVIDYKNSDHGASRFQKENTDSL